MMSDAHPDDARLGAIARGHQARLVRFVRRLGMSSDGAEDVAQAAFLVTWEALPRVAAGRERAFLYASALRIACRHRRRAPRETLGHDHDMERDPSPHPLPDELVYQKQLRERVEALLDTIEWPSRTVFERFELDGLTIPEIAHAMAITPKTAVCRLRRARRHLREASARLR
jgi:RNA polymerase sigma-70 factor (ECF subfamily)